MDGFLSVLADLNSYHYQLNFDPFDIPFWASRYVIVRDEDVEKLARGIMARGFLTKKELIAICRWKTPNSVPQVSSNSAEYVEAATFTALSTPYEKMRIEVLMSLNGVSWSNSSAVLHYGHQADYPIIDYRSLGCLIVNPVPTSFYDLWWGYTRFCRQLIEQVGVSMRTLDRALQQYFRENY